MASIYKELMPSVELEDYRLITISTGMSTWLR